MWFENHPSGRPHSHRGVQAAPTVLDRGRQIQSWMGREDLGGLEAEEEYENSLYKNFKELVLKVGRQ